MIGLVLKSAKSFKALQLVRIQFPIIVQSNAEKENSLDEDSGSIFKTTQEDVYLLIVLSNLEALCKEHPFVAWPIGPSLIQVVCPKTVVAKLFKALFAQQRTLGIRLTDLKSHVILSPMDPEELLQAVSTDILSSLQNNSNWHPVYLPSPDQTGTLLLGLDPMASSADGKVHNTPLIDIQIEISGADTLVLLLKPSTVRFRHSTIAAFSHPDTLPEASKAAEGSLCRVLPTLTPAIIQKLRIASDKEAKKIEKEWSRAGFSSPAATAASTISNSNTTWRHIVDLRFEDDEDAPTTPFPACAVLSYLGFDPVDAKLHSPGVLGALQRVQADLNNAAYKLFGGGGGGLVIKEMRKWDNNPRSNVRGKPVDVPATTGFQSAAATLEAALTAAAAPAAAPSVLEKLGEVIDLSILGVADNDSSEGPAAVRVKKPHARAGPGLLAYLARLEKEEAAEAAAASALNNTQKKAALPPSMALAAQNANADPAKKSPFLGAKRALPTAAQKAPKASKKSAAATDAGGSKPPAAPKATKAPAAEIDVAALDVPGLEAAGKLATLTIPQLKAFCRSIKQPVGGKKSDLETRIKTHLGIAVKQ